MRRFLACSVAFLLAAAPFSLRSVRADDVDQDAAARSVKTLLAKAPADDVPGLWALGKDLAAITKLAVPALREALATASPGARLAIGRALVLLSDETKGVEALQGLVDDASAPVALKVAALKIIEREGEQDQAEWLAKSIDDTLEPSLKMAKARALWKLNSTDKAKAKQVMLEYLKSEDRDRRAEGALALGSIGAAAEAKPILLELAGEPTERGRSAAFLLDILTRDQVEEARLRNAGPGAVTPTVVWPLLDEMRELLLKDYVDETAVETVKLENGAAAGMTKSLDKHTSFLSPEENSRLMQQSLDTTYAGVGALVNLDPDNGERFTVSRPIFGGPLYKAGLRAGDMIVKIGGDPTEGLTIDECVRKLKGPAGTPVVISVFRRGWTEERDFTLIRANITMPTTAYDILPGDVGMLQINSFGEDTAREVQIVLDKFAAAGVKSVVLDLRGNGGGYLDAAVNIASEFLPAGTRVVSEKGREGVYRASTHNSHGPSKERPNWPLRVLVDANTASAAEILSGALSVHGRARLIGSQTYGKGSVQLPIQLKSRPGEPFEDQPRDVVIGLEDANGNGQVDPGERVRLAKVKNGRYDAPEKFTDENGNGVWDKGEEFVDANHNGSYDAGEPFTDTNKNGRWDPGALVKITVARYYLPDGRNLNGKYEVKNRKTIRTGGIEPDVELKADDLDLWERQGQQDIFKTGAIKTYLESKTASDTELFDRLARSDRADPSSYPGFDELYAGLKTKISKQAVRVLLRTQLREMVSDRLGRELVGDPVDDTALKFALVEELKELGVDPKTIPDLAFLADVVVPPKKVAEEKTPPAMEPEKDPAK